MRQREELQIKKQSELENRERAQEVILTALYKYIEYERLLETGQLDVTGPGVAGAPYTDEEIRNKTKLNQALKVLGLDTLK